MSVHKLGHQIMVYGGKHPLIRRDTNTTLVSLDKDDVLQLITDLSSRVEGVKRVWLAIEADHIYAKDMD